MWGGTALHTHLSIVTFPPFHKPPTAPKQNWAGTLISEALLAGGSLCLFAIFVLIIIYWADLLKKVRTGPMCCD